MARIDSTAHIEAGACLADDVEIGPFCTVGANVTLGAGVRLVSHVAIAGHTTIGEGTVVYPFASLGSPPQSVSYKGEPTRLSIGSRCIVREHVTMNTGTVGGHGETVVGDGGFFMVGVHIAHDCIIGNNVIFANNVTLGGHVSVGDNVFMGGLSAAHQFARIGEQSIIGGMCGVRSDIIPFGALIEGRPGLGGLNIIGMKRRGFSRVQIHALRAAYRQLFYSGGTMAERIERVAVSFKDDANVMRVIDFARNVGKRRLTVPNDVDDGGERDAA